MAKLDTYAGRVTYCLGLLALEEGVPRILQEDLAARIKSVGGTLYPGPTISRWLKRWPKNFDDMLALANVLRADPGWLYFGPAHTTARGPLRDPFTPDARAHIDQLHPEQPEEQPRRRA